MVTSDPPTREGRSNGARALGSRAHQAAAITQLPPLMTCNHCTTISRAPVVQRFANCQVRIYAKDHPPPHFHVRLNDGREAWVSIDPIEIIHGRVATWEIAEVLAWAKERQVWLAQTFEELQR